MLIFCLIIPFGFIGCENKNKNSLATPTIVEIKNGTIVFDPVYEAEYYTISINDYEFSVDANYNNNVQIIDSKINYNASQIFVVGDSYSVKIRANSSKKNNSAFSSVYSYKHSGSIEKPENVKIVGTTLVWDVVKNASYYLVKITTPNDKIIYDKENNVLENDDSESISKANLTEYSFNLNKFDFTSILSTAGNYNFYVCAVLSDGSTYSESGYTVKTSYLNQVKLSTPINGNVVEINDELHMSTVVDENANAVYVKCNDVENTVELSRTDIISKINNNYIDINLNKFFAKEIYENNLNFENLGQFSFQTQSRFESNNVDETSKTMYLNSELSSHSMFEKTYQLKAPQVNVEHNSVNNCHIVTWTCDDQHLISGYKLFVFTPTEVKEYVLDSQISKKLIYEDFVAVAVKAEGVGNYLSSSLSTLTNNPSLTQNLNISNCEATGNTISWTNVSADYYVVELNNEISTTTTNNFTIPADKLKTKETQIKISAIKANKKSATKTFDLSYSISLATPTIRYNQGFVSSNIYLLTFTGVENAIGYHIYLNNNTNPINTLYTDTRIDLSQYICKEGEYSDYQIKIVAVADIYSLYSNSNKSSSVSVSHIRKLEAPEFKQVNHVNQPITSSVVGNETKYTLQFYSVSGAQSYEVLINYNKINIPATGGTGSLISVDVTSYLIAANKYEIKVRALPNSSSHNVIASDYNTDFYELKKQLAMVENIQVTENNNVYTLSFNPVNNAEKYRVRIVKLNDNSYVDYLNTEFGLSPSFEVTQAEDVTKYLKQFGVYYFYVTALAREDGGYYINSHESTTYGIVDKLETLNSPANIQFNNNSSSEYLLSWVGDSNADYYFVKLTSPNNLSYEFNVYNSTSTNINDYMTVQGTYNVQIYSMINPTSNNAKHYASSPASTKNEVYFYQQEKDFLRYSVSMYGNDYDFVINDLSDLKGLLWHHYLYGVDEAGLSLMLKLQVKEGNELETVRDAILRLTYEATQQSFHNFANDETWLELVAETTDDIALFKHVCKTILDQYPELNYLGNQISINSDSSAMFTLHFENKLDGEKINIVDDEENLIGAVTNANYGNDFKYIDLYSRKSSTGLFPIDSRQEMMVTTTEQLLQAVQHNHKPKFIGNSSVAETVYANAKLVLSAITTDYMTDLEKVTAIFDWLEYGFDLTYYNDNGTWYISGAVENEKPNKYGLYKHYYLEGIFEDISLAPNGDIVIGNNLATSFSYSKAFALLCAIEGIDAVVVNGCYDYFDMSINAKRTVKHSWNKVMLNTSVGEGLKEWYVVDLTFSDNRIYFNLLSNGYGISSHSLFLISDTSHESKLISIASNNSNVTADKRLTLKDNSSLISSSYIKVCENNYDFYSNSTFGLTLEQISSVSNKIVDDNTVDFNYIKSLVVEPIENPNSYYQRYNLTSGYGSMKALLLNAIIYSKHNANINESGNSMFEFTFSNSQNNNSLVFNENELTETFDDLAQYSISLTRKGCYTVQDSTTGTTTVIFIVKNPA